MCCGPQATYKFALCESCVRMDLPSSAVRYSSPSVPQSASGDYSRGRPSRGRDLRDMGCGASTAQPNRTGDDVGYSAPMKSASSGYSESGVAPSSGGVAFAPSALDPLGGATSHMDSVPTKKRGGGRRGEMLQRSNTSAIDRRSAPDPGEPEALSVEVKTQKRHRPRAASFDGGSIA